MTFLKKVGEIIAKGLDIVMGFGPMFGAMVPAAAGGVQTVTSELLQIGQIIVSIETAGAALAGSGSPLTGAQKLTAAGPLVAQIVMQSALLANHKIADETKFKAACAGLASNMADLLNSLKDNVDTVNKA